jgi:hypothetical protein
MNPLHTENGKIALLWKPQRSNFRHLGILRKLIALQSDLIHKKSPPTHRKDNEIFLKSSKVARYPPIIPIRNWGFYFLGRTGWYENCWFEILILYLFRKPSEIWSPILSTFWNGVYVEKFTNFYSKFRKGNTQFINVKSKFLENVHATK